MEKTLEHFKLKQSKEYDLFKFYKENREINIKKVKEYKQSIKENGLKQPINVKYENSHYYITDGQHRFIALIELEYTVVFIVDYDDNYSSEDILTINSNRGNTKTKDYIHYHAEKGFEEYVKIIGLYEEYPNVKNTLLNEIFIKSRRPKNPATKITYCIHKGTMQVDYMQGKTILLWLQKISEANGQKNLYQSKIVRALKHIYNNNKNFNIDMLCNKIKDKEIRVENNEYNIITYIKEQYNKKIRQDDLLLV